MVAGIFLRVALIIGLLAALVFGGERLYQEVYHSGYVAGQAVDAKAHDAAVAKREQENKQAAAAFAQAAQQQKDAYEKELSDVRAAGAAAAARRVPVRAGFCGSGASGAAGAGKAAGAASDAGGTAATEYFPDKASDDLRQLAIEADTVLAQARAIKEAAKSSQCFQEASP